MDQRHLTGADIENEEPVNDRRACRQLQPPARAGMHKEDGLLLLLLETMLLVLEHEQPPAILEHADGICERGADYATDLLGGGIKQELLLLVAFKSKQSQG